MKIDQKNKQRSLFFIKLHTISETILEVVDDGFRGKLSKVCDLYRVVFWFRWFSFFLNIISPIQEV